MNQNLWNQNLSNSRVRCPHSQDSVAPLHAVHGGIHCFILTGAARVAGEGVRVVPGCPLFSDMGIMSLDTQSPNNATSCSGQPEIDEPELVEPELVEPELVDSRT